MGERYIEGRGWVPYEALVDELEKKKKVLGGTLAPEEAQKLKELKAVVAESTRKNAEDDTKRTKSSSPIIKLRENK